MNWVKFSGSLALVVGSSAITALPANATLLAQAIPDGTSIPHVDIDSVLRLERDFFEEGRIQFEQEIDYLMEGAFLEEVPLLTIDKSVEFNSERLEMLKEEPRLPNNSLFPAIR